MTISLRLTAAALAAAALAAPAHAATMAPVSGAIERLTLDDPADPWSGGTIVVGGEAVILPRNLLLDLPANRLTLQQLFAQAPAACLAAGESGLARADTCNAGGGAGFATLSANRTTSGNVIAGDVLVEKGIDSVTGTVTYVDYTDGYYRVNGIPGDRTTGTMVRLNDPTGRHTVQQGLGCDPAAPNCSADPRFTLDPDNYVNVFSTGYPYCIPSTVQRTFVDRLGLGTTTARAATDGTGDVLCPQTNRPASGIAADSRRFAPIKVGDSVTAEGNFERVNGVAFLSAHTSMILGALTTSNAPGQPDYIFLEEVFVDAPGFQNQRARSLLIGFQTLAPADVLVWTIHRDPGTNAAHEFPLATTRGCDIAGGPQTCTGQGLGAGGGDIFRIRYDVDFLVGAKPKLNPCSHLLADVRMGPGVCPGGGGEFNITDMFGVLSPVPREIQTRTGKKFASLQPGGVPLVTIDVGGNEATNGQYLFPFGINLGGIDIANAFEFDLNAVATPFGFSGLPWALDRRLSPGGCIGPCEATPQPLDPFPFEGIDPRVQASVPQGNYFAPAFTASTLSRAADRILSFVDPALGNFNGNATRLAWPPVDPAPRPIVATPDLALVCAAPPPPIPPPAANADAAVTLADVAVQVLVLANDTDPTGGVLSVTAVANGANGTTATDGTSVTYTPAAGFVGTDTFLYTVASTSGATATGTVTVTVNPNTNLPPTALADGATTRSATAVVVPVLANDSDPNGDVLTVVAVGPAANGTTTFDAGSVTYTPNAGFAGTDVFSYTVSDGLATATAQVTVTVVAPETLVVTIALFRVGTAEWRVAGTSTVEGATITIHNGTTLAGPVVGTATVVAGAWQFRQSASPISPDPSRRVSIESTGGAVRLSVPVTVR